MKERRKKLEKRKLSTNHWTSTVEVTSSRRRTCLRPLRNRIPRWADCDGESSILLCCEALDGVGREQAYRGLVVHLAEVGSHVRRRRVRRSVHEGILSFASRIVSRCRLTRDVLVRADVESVLSPASKHVSDRHDAKDVLRRRTDLSLRSLAVVRPAVRTLGFVAELNVMHNESV